jgi:hypothetical protein
LSQQYPSGLPPSVHLPIICWRSLGSPKDHHDVQVTIVVMNSSTTPRLGQLAQDLRLRISSLQSCSVPNAGLGHSCLSSLSPCLFFFALWRPQGGLVLAGHRLTIVIFTRGELEVRWRLWRGNCHHHASCTGAEAVPRVRDRCHQGPERKIGLRRHGSRQPGFVRFTFPSSTSVVFHSFRV